MTPPAAADADAAGSPAPTTAATRRQHPLLRRILLYGASRGSAEALLAIRGLALASILGPEAFGAWALFRLAGRYAGIGSLGIHRGLEFEVVQARAAGTSEGRGAADADGRAALAFVLTIFGTMALVSLALSFATADARLASGMRAFAAGVLIEQIWLYAVVNLRARGDLRRFALNEVLNSALHLVFAVALASLLALDGAFIGFVLAGAISLMFIVGRVPMRPIWAPDRLRRLFRVGLPMAAVLISGLTLATVDRLVVAAVGGTALLGLYAFAVAIASLANTAAWIVRTVIFPGVYERAAGAGARTAIEEHVRRTIRPFTLLFPPLLGALAIIMGPAVALLLPQFTGAVTPARLFIFTGVLGGLASLTSVGVVAGDRQRLLPPFSVGGVVLNVGLSYAALRGGLGLPGVAVAALISQGLYAAAALSIMAHAGEIAQPRRLLFDSFVPLLWALAMLVLIMRFMPMMTMESAAAGLGVFLLSMLPLGPRLIGLYRRVSGG